MNEVRKKPFPRLTGKQAFDRLGVFSDIAPPIAIAREVLDQILEFSDTSPNIEVGGFLLGEFCCDPTIDQPFINISGYVQATDVESGFRSLTFTHESWSRLHRQLATQFPDKQVVGWHHTHPGFGIFLSRQDEFIHRNFFDQPWQVALVVDPRRGELGFFQWQGDQIIDSGFLVAPRDPKCRLRNSKRC